MFDRKPNKSPRDQSKEISTGKSDEHHLGKYTPITLHYEITALKITATAFRGKKWNSRFETISKAISDLKKGREKDGLNSRLLSCLRNES